MGECRARARAIFHPVASYRKFEETHPYARQLLIYGILGYSIRVMFMPIAMHIDLIGVLTISNFVVDAPLIEKLGSTFFVQPPPLYFLMGTSVYMQRMLGVDLISRYGVKENVEKLLQLDILGPQFYADSDLKLFLILTKIIYFIFDICLAMILLKMCNMMANRRETILTYKIWCLNPVSVFVPYIVGQTDILATFFMTLALYFMVKNNHYKSMISIGLAAIMKTYFLVLVFPFAVILSRMARGQSQGFQTTFIKYFIVGSIFPVMSWVSVSIPATLTVQKSYFANYFLGYSAKFNMEGPFETQLYVFPLLLIVFYALALLKREWTTGEFIHFLLAYLLMYYAFDVFHPQWFLWVVPLFSLVAAKDKRLLNTLPLLMVLFWVHTWRWNNAHALYLFAPLKSNFLHSPGYVDFLTSVGFPATQLINAIGSVFSGIMIVLAILELRHIILDHAGVDHHNEIAR